MTTGWLARPSSWLSRFPQLLASGGLAAMLLTATTAAGCGGAAKPPAPTPPTTPTSSAPPLPADSGDEGPRSSGEVPMVCTDASEEAMKLYGEGYELGEKGDLAGAEAKYKAAIERDPKLCDAMDNLAVQYRRAGRVPEAIALYERSVAIAPQNELAWQNLGLAYQSVDRDDDALRAFDRLIALSPTNPEGWYGTGHVHLFSGRFTEARPPLRHAEQLYLKSGSPLVSDVRMLLGLTAAGLGEWAEVRALLVPLYPEVGRNGLVNLFLGEAYLQPDSMDRAKARTFLERARDQGIDPPAELWQRAGGS